MLRLSGLRPLSFLLLLLFFVFPYQFFLLVLVSTNHLIVFQVEAFRLNPFSTMKFFRLDFSFGCQALLYQDQKIRLLFSFLELKFQLVIQSFSLLLLLLLLKIPCLLLQYLALFLRYLSVVFLQFLQDQAI